MNEPVQLTLWPDAQGRVEVACEHCGWRNDVLPVLRARQKAREQAVLQHPAVDALRERTAAFLESVLPLLSSGQPVGVSQLADETNYTPAGALRQVRHLVASGILAAEPKRPGGTYCHYRLIHPNGVAP